MARRTERLTDLWVRKVKKPGTYPDGRQLYLQVSESITKSWLFRFARGGRERWMGLGPYPDVPLAEARQKALTCRRQLLEGIDPIEHRRTARLAAKLDEARGLTFRGCAERYIAAHETGWRNQKHRQQWRNTLASHVYPTLGELPVAAIDTGLVMRALEPIWRGKPETASRVRGRIESVLDWATVRGYRQGENPARWRGHLQALLPAKTKIRRVEHHAALPWQEMPAFMAELRRQPGIAARALEFAILGAARTGEVIGARWDEIEGAVWTVPPDRMKAGRPHRVPLVPAAVELLRALPREAGSSFVFIGGRAGRPLSQMALAMVLRRMGRPEITVHGFRSTFRDWAAEATSHPRELAEAALAHVLRDKVEAAYQRGDILDRRRRLMEEWARWCETPLAEGEVVVPLRAAR